MTRDAAALGWHERDEWLRADEREAARLILADIPHEGPYLVTVADRRAVVVVRQTPSFDAMLRARRALRVLYPPADHVSYCLNLDLRDDDHDGLTKDETERLGREP